VHRWEDTGMELREIEKEIMAWIYLAQDRDQRWAVMKMVINL